MKKIFLTLAIASFLFSCKTGTIANEKSEVDVTIDLVNVKDDKVMVSILAPTFTSETATFNIPKIVPGTYSDDDYGKYIENVQAFDAKGNLLTVAKLNVNSFAISNATKLSKVTYLVNDTYDIENGGEFGKSDDVFSPAGTNIDAGKNFMLNLHGFVGYFTSKEELPYKLTINHPANLLGVSAMNDLNPSETTDVFMASKYATLVEMPIMYSKPDFTSFMVDDMEIIISVYSPTGKYTAKEITPYMENMMRAQKKFLGKFNATKKYAILLYLSSMSPTDAKGFGALEHPTSTTVVMPEIMGLEALQEQLKDVVSHEFFHIVTPLTVHSNEIQFFDFNNPEMSEHLWMYEGVTEYFANLFQVHQDLIDEDAFYERMAAKIKQAATMNDKMSFTKMSKNVLKEPYKDQYINVYQKGALIAMCLDIEIREKSNGQKGILQLMQDLSNAYGTKKAFKDDELFAKITELTYPSVGAFLNKYVAGETPIPYADYFAKMGVTQAKVEAKGNPFIVGGNQPIISYNPETKEFFYLPEIEINAFMKELGLKNNDIILEINGVTQDLTTINQTIGDSFGWKDGDAITMKIKRDGKEIDIKGKVVIPNEIKEGYRATDNNKKTLREAWLKG